MNRLISFPILFVLFTYVLFIASPFDYFGRASYYIVGFYLLLCWGFYLIGFIFFYRNYSFVNLNAARGGIEYINHRFMFLGAFFSVVLIVEVLYEFSSFDFAISNIILLQGDLYNSYQENLLDSNNSVALDGFFWINVLGYPFIIYTVVIGVVNWKFLSFKGRVLVVFPFLLFFFGSLLTGKNKDLFDVVAIIFLPIIVVMGRLRIKLVILFFIIVFLFIFILDYRIGSRMQNAAPYSCLDITYVCISNSSIFYDAFMASSPLKSFVFYITNGYVGLSLALGLDFNFSFGVGHSSFLTSIFDKTISSEVYLNTFNFRLRELGWHDRYLWLSAYTWLANDVSFYCLPILFMGIGFFVHGLLYAYKKYNINSALILLSFFGYFVIYSSTGFQLGLSPPLYFSFLFWLAKFSFDCFKVRRF